ncbi:MAG: hypothetical protein RLY63_697, partial [Chloroflexota bacterium]
MTTQRATRRGPGDAAALAAQGSCTPRGMPEIGTGSLLYVTPAARSPFDNWDITMGSERAPEIVPISAANKPAQVDIVGDRIRIASLEIVDRALAGYLESRSAEERPEMVERALRVGLMALQSASGSIDVDHVRRAFDKF